MLAAGNRVIIKPSEYTPACAALLREMVIGDLELSRAFSAVAWDHLLYTGSPGVGRQVMAAAAANLTPVTLELGGKCPALMTPGSVTSRNVEAVVGTKLVKNGQMCVSVDYALVHRDEIETFIEEAHAFIDRASPDYSRSDDCTGTISQHHLTRLANMRREAEARQVRVVEVEAGGRIDGTTRRMPLALLVDPAADLRVMTEEIFGPLLPNCL